MGDITKRIMDYRSGAISFPMLVEWLKTYDYQAPPRYAGGPKKPLARVEYTNQHLHDDPTNTFEEITQARGQNLLTRDEFREIKRAVSNEVFA